MILEINYTNSCREMHDFIFGNEVNSCRKMHKYVGIIHQFPIYRIILNNLIFLLLVCIKFPFRLTFPLCIYRNYVRKYLDFHSCLCLLSFPFPLLVLLACPRQSSKHGAKNTGKHNVTFTCNEN